MESDPDKEIIDAEFTPVDNPAMDPKLQTVELKWFRRGGAQEKFDDKAKKAFLKEYAKTYTKTRAARKAGVCVQTVNNHLKQDKEFAAACEEARQAYCDRVEETAQHLALEGTLEPIFSKDGVLLGTKRVFNAHILGMMMRRTNPEYRDKSELDLNHNVGGVLVVPARGSDPNNGIDQKQALQQFAIAHHKEPGT